MGHSSLASLCRGPPAQHHAPRCSHRPSLIPHLDRDRHDACSAPASGVCRIADHHSIALRADVSGCLGRLHGCGDVLGLYSRAYKLMNMPTDLYAKVADRVRLRRWRKCRGNPPG